MPSSRTMLVNNHPLMDAAWRGQEADVAALLADGADVNKPASDGSGWTALLLACAAGHTNVVKTLLAANADIHQTNNDGCTPLWMASEKGRSEIVTILLAANAEAARRRCEEGRSLRS